MGRSSRWGNLLENVVSAQERVTRQDACPLNPFRTDGINSQGSFAAWWLELGSFDLDLPCY
jgi:hypothetical protein